MFKQWNITLSIKKQVLQCLKDNLTMAQNRMKQQVDQRHSERNFDVDD